MNGRGGPREGSGRPPHEPTEDTRRQVRILSGLAVPHVDIARMLAIHITTLTKHYEDDIAAGRAEANLKVARAMFKAATRESNPNVVAGMFWLKNRGGWKDIGANPANVVELHLVAAQLVGKQLRDVEVAQVPPTIEHKPLNDRPVVDLDAPPPLE